VVSGQGEETFAELVDRLASGRDLHLLPGVTFRDRDGSVFANLPRPTRDVNALPRHDYGLVDIEAYYAAKGQRQLDYISSVGCRFRCAFCADPAVYQRSWFGLAADRMASELADLHAAHPYEEVAFQDETYFTRRERVEEISRALIGAGLGASWTGTMRADQGFRLPDETLELCRRSGLRRVMIGVEAGTDEQLARIRKDITIAQVFDTAAKLVRHDVGAIWNFIVGFPDEPEDSFRATLDVARRLRAMSPDFEAAVFFYKPYPGNELAELVGARGFPIPTDLAGWADFDYVGSAGPWVTSDRVRRAERFRFYQRFAYGRHQHPLARPMQALARWRVERGAFGLPVEKMVVERLRPGPRLS
jgi:anaerobic magnesium-protoporphyrin IX monomethyl ester cyclase